MIMRDVILAGYASHPVIFWLLAFVGLASPRSLVGLLVLYAVFIVLFR